MRPAAVKYPNMLPRWPGEPYCHHPCYGALFGPKVFGHGTRTECHAAFGRAGYVLYDAADGITPQVGRWEATV